ncbi:YbjQ family protein, partial [Nostoc sp. NIES-2111]
MLVATTNDLAGYRIVEHLGLVRGITVRSRSVIGNIGGAIQSLFGGNITVYTSLAERARQEAFDLMVAQAAELGADAIIAMRHDANDIMDLS